MPYFSFEILHRSKKSRARVGRLHTPHGVIDTPAFVAVGTNGTLKALDNATLHNIGLQLMFCNTYHLLLQPGVEVVKNAGGLHRFINRTMPLITDSGGFQVFSLAYGSVADELKSRGLKKAGGSVLKIDEEGVIFRSYRDGAKVLLTPESSVLAQKDFGADIIIPLDELPPYHIDAHRLKESFDRTHRWQERSLKTHLNDRREQAMYGVVHGGIDSELRRISCEALKKMEFDGYAIGGSVGKNRTEMEILLQQVTPHLPPLNPVHLLGIGDLPSLALSIPLGIDSFDSSYPTRCARHGICLTKEGPLNLTKGVMSKQVAPIEEGCTCYTCTHYTRSYLNHLFKAREIASMTLATIHNIHFMVQLMEHYRQQIWDDAI